MRITQSWRKNHHERIQWTNYIACNIRGRPAEPLTKAKLSIVRHSHRMLDYDGLVGSMKPVVDSLVQLGILSDDSWTVLGAWNVSQKYRPKSDGPRLEILLQELPDKRN